MILCVILLPQEASRGSHNLPGGIYITRGHISCQVGRISCQGAYELSEGRIRCQRGIYIVLGAYRFSEGHISCHRGTLEYSISYYEEGKPPMEKRH